ncbi:hypothetical protein DND132_0191 [Pseudodesulfovibrio mercurii]|uniref:Uncharacterized protein n=1 Tax=Pseudodesulfovibrio mercurii TaxID=641491 RepID=F0JDW9_9BACT|nr:hypothetical protein [Pseudodesulfovibrio mercurii]EGB13409.1 hypothetical protein DND132_0191 [Pseudodesulfovibrio mercurii]
MSNVARYTFKRQGKRDYVNSTMLLEALPTVLKQLDLPMYDEVQITFRGVLKAQVEFRTEIERDQPVLITLKSGDKSYRIGVVEIDEPLTEIGPDDAKQYLKNVVIDSDEAVLSDYPPHLYPAICMGLADAMIAESTDSSDGGFWWLAKVTYYVPPAFFESAPELRGSTKNMIANKMILNEVKANGRVVASIYSTRTK